MQTDSEGIFAINESAELGWIFVSAAKFARQVFPPAARPKINSAGLLEVRLEPAGTIVGTIRG